MVGHGPEKGPALELARSRIVGEQVTVSDWGGVTETAEAYRRMHVPLVPSRATATWVGQFGRMIVEAHARRDGRSVAYIAHHWLHADLKWPRARLAKHVAQYRVYVLTHRTPREGLGERERELLYEVAFHRQYTQERRKPRRYESQSARSARV